MCKFMFPDDCLVMFQEQESCTLVRETSKLFYIHFHAVDFMLCVTLCSYSHGNILW